MASKPKARYAFVLLTLIAAFLVIALVMCLPSDNKEPESGGKLSADPLDARTPAQRFETTSTGAGTPLERLTSQTGGSPAAGPERPKKVGRMAIIIDDAGYNLEDLGPFLEYPGPLAIAVLPNLPFSAESARRIVSAGKTLLLHCPMEPLNGENPGPGALLTGHTDEKLESLLESALATVPGAVGVNNHMGSKATADERIMSVFFSFLKEKGLFFVDSRTTVESVGERTAGLYSVPFLDRDVFMDNEKDTEDIRQNIESGIAKAESRGSAVLIGHIHTPQILAILEKEEQVFRESEIRIVDLAEIFKYEKGTWSEDTRD
jgi:polysaccharide deacetylase 2 family uncharacterized protein YibQ